MNKFIFFKITLTLSLCFLFLFSFSTNAQCINTTSFVTYETQNNGATEEFAFCFEANNFNTIVGLTAQGNYVFSLFGGNGDGYITITTTENVVIAHGPSPLTVENISNTSVRFHVADTITCESSGCYFASIQFLPSCPEPKDLSISNITTSGAIASWLAGIETSWDLEYDVEGFTLGSGTLVSNLTSNNYSFSSLNPGSTYEYYVKAKCAIDDHSFWSGPFTFTTTCNPVSEIYETFDIIEQNQLLPNCWSSSDNASILNVKVVAASGNPASAPNCLEITASNENDTYAVLPPVTNLNANTHRLRFNAFANEANTTIDIGYLTISNNLDSFVLLGTIELPVGNFNQAQAYTIIPNAVPSGVNMLAFRLSTTSDFQFTQVFIDDIRWEPISNCFEPIFASSSNITVSSADLIWNPGSSETEWEVQYGIQNFTLGEGVSIPIFNNPSFNLTSLIENTNYQYYVRAVCGENNKSGWSNPHSFKTNCASVTEFNENFDSTIPFYGLLPNCWNKSGNSITNGVVEGSIMSQPNQLILNGEDLTTNAYVIMPTISNLQEGTHRLKFRAISDAQQSVLELGYITNINDIGTFVYLTEFEIGNITSQNANNFSFIPNQIPLGVKNLVFKNGGLPGGSTNIFIDDVSWEVIPSCQEPTQLTVTTITNTSASLGWTANGSANQWEIEYGEQGFAVGSGTVIPTTTNPQILNGLTGNTSYEFYVRSICSVTNNSTWTGPFKFKTLCDDVTEFFENFDTTEPWQSLIPDCWTRGTNNTFSNAVVDLSVMSAPNCLLMDAFGITLYTVLPSVSNLQANTHRLKFKAQGNGLNSGTLELGYITNLNNLNTFVTLQEYLIPLNTNVLDFFYNPTTTIPSGIKNLVFRNSGSVNGPLSIRIDDVKWEIKPTIAPTCATDLQASVDPNCGTADVTLSWNPVPNADAYKITIGTTPGGSDIVNNLEIGNNLSYIFDSPTAATNYYWSIVPFNAAGLAPTCTFANFVTPNGLCYCEPQYFDDAKKFGDLISNVQIEGTTLANNSGTEPINPFYKLFIGQPNYTAILLGGQSYDMTISVGTTNNQKIAVWIDKNNNGIFDNDELIGFSTSALNSSSSTTLQLKIPCVTTTGLYRMRVRTGTFVQQNQIIHPCNMHGYGETEDYYITINAGEVPTTPIGETTQTIVVNSPNEATLQNLVVAGTNIKWFESLANALSGNNPLSLETVIANGSVYYAVSTNGSCLSDPLAITVTVTLGINDFETDNFKLYPNPVSNIVAISSDNVISEVIIYNALGQQIMSIKPNETQTQMDLSPLKPGTYVVKIISQEKVKTIKLVKNI